MLQRSASGEEGVLQVIVEEAADGRHVDVRKTGEAAGEICGVVIGAEEASKLSIKDVFGS